MRSLRAEPVVYFLRFGPHVKIGTTTNLPARLHQIGVPGTVMFTIPGGHDQEADFHRYYARNRIKDSEWFELTPEMEAHLDVIRRSTEWLLANPCDPEDECELCYPYPRILRDLKPEITEEDAALEAELFRLLFGIEL